MDWIEILIFLLIENILLWEEEDASIALNYCRNALDDMRMKKDHITLDSLKKNKEKHLYIFSWRRLLQLLIFTNKWRALWEKSLYVVQRANIFKKTCTFAKNASNKIWYNKDVKSVKT